MDKLKQLLLFLIVTVFLYVVFLNNAVFSIDNSFGTPSSDVDTNYSIALSTYRGEGLYKNFSIVYPPGRFIAQSILFHFTSPSVPATRLYFNTVAPILFPPLLFFLTVQLFRILLKNKKKTLNTALQYFAAAATTLTYIFFVGGAQEAHVFVALFFLISFSNFKSERLKYLLQGVALGLVFLFRIDSGVFLLISLLLSGLNKNVLKKYLSLVYGLALVWIPLLLYIALTGSIFNFFYDTLYLGLIVLAVEQQLMSLPIPPPPVGLLFFSILVFLLGSTAALYSETNNSWVKSFSVFAVLSFTAALARSDEGHLWYGSVWLGVMIIYSIYSALSKKFSLRYLPSIVCLSLAFWAVGFIIIKYESTSIFVVAVTALFIIVGKIRKKELLSYKLVLAGLLTSLFIFHSLSFLKIRFHLPTISLKTSFLPNVFSSDKGEVAGLKIDPKTLPELEAIKKRLDRNSPYLFIYPDKVIYYSYFSYSNPTRHYYHTGETTVKLQKEIIDDLIRTKTNNFLVISNSDVKNRPVLTWILTHTYVDSTYIIDGQRAELRKKRR